MIEFKTNLTPTERKVFAALLTVLFAWIGWYVAGRTGNQPLGWSLFLGAAAFQWVNPKGWTMLIGALSAFAPANASVADIGAIALVFGAVCVPCVLLWTGFGSGLRRLLGEGGKARAVNLAMAALLVLSALPAMVEIARGI